MVLSDRDCPTNSREASNALIEALEKEAQRQLVDMDFQGDHNFKIMEVIGRYLDGLYQHPIVHHISETVAELIQLTLEPEVARRTQATPSCCYARPSPNHA